MLIAALEAEVEAYVTAAKSCRDDKGRALVTRNGKGRKRTILTGAGALELRAPRVDDRRLSEESSERMRFRSEILPPYLRKSPKVSAVLPLLYLHGLSTGDFGPALTEFFGTDSGLSASAVNRLTTAWQAERDQFMKTKLEDRDYVYMWVGWDPLQRSPGLRRPPLLPGCGGCPARRRQRADRHPRRLSRVHRVVG